MAVKTDDLSDTKRKVSRVCHELYAGIEETVSREILASCAVKLCEQKCSRCSDYPDCKIYFVFFIFVVCANHENIFTTKISRSTVVNLILISNQVTQTVDLLFMHTTSYLICSYFVLHKQL